ncbi:MAG: hypothetical protein ABFS43_08075 [Thermodesulfobacteriota bacterium]
MQKLVFILKIAVIVFFATPLGTSMAGEAAQDSPWEKFSLNAGVFASRINSNVRFGSGLGTTVNLEDALGLEADNQVFRIDTYWRFTRNRKHRLDFTWFSFKRSATRTLTDNITVNPPDRGEVDLETGQKVESYFDLDIYEISYRYSFFQDDRVDVAGGVGFYMMPINLGLRGTGLVEKEADQSFTAPLPALNLKLDVVISPKWYFRNGTQLFYVEYNDIVGSLTNVRSAIEYNPWKHVGLGLGIDAMRMYLEGNGNLLWPENDIKGTVVFNYIGLQFYGRVFF